MADDTRPSPSPTTTPSTLPTTSPSGTKYPTAEDFYQPPRRPQHRYGKDLPKSQASKMWSALENPAGGPVNEIPGGTYNSAGGKPREASWRDAFDFSQSGVLLSRTLHDGCVRDGLLVGIGAGGAVGGVRFILQGLSGMLATTNWMVGGFTVASCGMHWWCMRRRNEEAKGIHMALQGMKILNEKKAREKAEAKAVAARAEIEKQEKLAAQRWWKVW